MSSARRVLRGALSIRYRLMAGGGKGKPEQERAVSYLIMSAPKVVACFREVLFVVYGTVKLETATTLS